MAADRRDDAALDAAIDRAVRDLLSAEPPAGLRQRVLQRLDDPPARRLTLPRLMLASALAAAVLVVFVLSQRPAERPASPAIVQTRPEAAPVPSAPAAHSRPPVVAQREPQVPRALVETIPRGQVVAQSLVMPAQGAAAPTSAAPLNDLDPLAVAAPVTIETIRHAAPDMTPITLGTIAITSLHVEPLAGGGQ